MRRNTNGDCCSDACPGGPLFSARPVPLLASDDLSDPADPHRDPCDRRLADTIARIVGQQVAKTIGQPVVIEK